MYYDPDLTGEHQNYKSENNVFKIHTPGQKIEFHEPVFLDGLIMHELGTINRPMVRGTDYEIELDDYDNTSMSKIQAYSPDFDKQLIKSLTITKTFVQSFKINIQFQKLYPINIKQALFYGNRLEVHPDLIASMIIDLQYLMHITRSVDNSIADDHKTPKLLEEDPHKSLVSNKITDEIHTVNTVEGRRYIRPLCGAFYDGDVTVEMVDNPDPLIPGEDYIFYGFDINRVRNTSSTDSIYNYILIKKEYVGDIRIGYHAYGGETTVSDVRVIDDKITDIINFLKESSFLTNNTLSTSPIIENMMEKINNLEEQVRILNNVRPDYGDVTSGASAVHVIRSNDAVNHWYNIATLYTVGENSEPVLADRMFLRMATKESEFQVDMMINVNINNPLNEILKVNVLSANYPKHYIPLVSYDNLSDIIRPRVRVIFNKNEDEYSGAILQLGFELKGLAQETVAFHDMSGKESSWKLLPSSEEIVEPQDNDIQLPNESHIYSTDNPDSYSIETLVPFDDGCLVFAGATPVNRPEGGFKEITINHYLADNVNIQNIKKCRVELQEGADGALFPVDINFSSSTDYLFGVATYQYNDEVGSISCDLYKDSDTGELVLKLISDIDQNTEAAVLNIRHIFLYL